jgi:hypothetical protein
VKNKNKKNYIFHFSPKAYSVWIKRMRNRFFLLNIAFLTPHSPFFSFRLARNRAQKNRLSIYGSGFSNLF